MGETLTYVIELAVGLGCVVAAVATARSRRLRWFALVLAVAGATAIVHAIARLAAVLAVAGLTAIAHAVSRLVA